MDECAILSNGLNFSLSPEESNMKNIHQGLDAFCKLLRIKTRNFDSNMPPEQVQFVRKFKNKTTFSQPSTDKVLEAYISVVQRETLRLLPTDTLTKNRPMAQIVLWEICWLLL